MRPYKLCLVFVGLTLSLPVYYAWAASAANDGTSSCETINCASTSIRGLYTSSGLGLGAGHTWVYQVFAAAADCLRLEVSSSTDLEMAVVSPDPAAAGSDPEGVGNIWADDDSGDEDNPLIKIDPVPRTGYYTVVVSRYDANAGHANFTLHYGRYNTGNPNCIPPTPVGTKPLSNASTPEEVNDGKN